MADESRVTYTAGAAQTNFTITFPYDLESHLFVNVDGVDTAFTVSGSDVVIAATVGGEEVEVYRDTQRATGPVVDFASGASVTEENLDDQAKQAVYLSQEIWDRLKTKMGTTSVLTLTWDADSRRMVSLADPTGAQDAATKAYIDAINAAIDARLDALEAGGTSAALPTATPSDIYDILEVDAAGDWVKADTVRSSPDFPNTVVRTGGTGLISADLLPSIVSGINDVANVGAGVGLYRDILSQVINLRSLVSNTVNAVTITLDGDEIDFAVVFSDGAAGAADKLWSSQKIETELATKSSTAHTHASTDDTDTPGTLTADTVWVVNTGGTAHEAIDFLDIDVPVAVADRKGRIVYWNASGDGTTLPPGAQRSTLAMSSGATPLPEWTVPPSPVAVAAPSVRRLTVATDWQDNASYPGWEVQVTELGQAWNWQRVATSYVPPGILKNGGRISCFATGEFSPGSSDPGLGLKLQLGAVDLLPAAPSGADGWLLNSDNMGWNVMHRLPDNTRWYLDVNIHSLGENASASGSRGGGSATVFLEGKLFIGELADGGGFATSVYPYGTAPWATVSGNWNKGVSYTAGDRVFHNMMWWEAIYTHTSQGTTRGALAHTTPAEHDDHPSVEYSFGGDEPGSGLFWKHHWRPLYYEFQIRQTNDVSTLGTFTNDQGLEVNLWATGPTQDVTTAPAAYRLTGAAYALGELVLGTDSKTYACISTYDPDGGGGAHGTERRPITGTGTTYGPWNQFWVDVTKGYSEMHIDAVEIFGYFGNAGYEPALL
jgi:hypothetical protein